MFRRTFEENPPHITFSADWQQRPFGNLVPGATVAISYDPNRLPADRDDITAFYRFAPNGPIGSKQLDKPTGQPVRRYSNDPVEATMMTTSIVIPVHAEELIVWFLNTGSQSWDSNYGHNYVFRFTSIDIQGEHATVVGGAFEVELTALPVIDSVAVNFTVTNAPRPFSDSVPLSAGEIANGRRPWSAHGISVPRGANIRFSFAYTVDGRTFIDDNDGVGFFAPKPLPTHRPAAFVAALEGPGA
ncbi:MAG TPA: DUF6209 family protein [Thermoanaerobaculia bacterium]|nr:DUF6209 family protein [Thermoanaerobaculia bacterium]